MSISEFESKYKNEVKLYQVFIGNISYNTALEGLYKEFKEHGEDFSWLQERLHV